MVTDGVKRNTIEKMMIQQVFSIEEALKLARGIVLTNKPRIPVIP